ncbi:exosortase U [Rhodopirellula sallentina]|nr:exosortase U [Rhodopirellula sallentina]
MRSLIIIAEKHPTHAKTRQPCLSPPSPKPLPDTESNRAASRNGGIIAFLKQQSAWTWFWVGLLVSGMPMLVIYFSRMWRLPQYQYFPFAILAVVGLAWSRSDRKFYPPTSWISIGSLALGAVAMAGGWYVRSPWMIAIAFFFFAAACLNVMRGPKDTSLLALALPLALLVRLPLGFDSLLVLRLQPITTQLSSLLLDVVRVPHAVKDNVIQLASRDLFVAEACSGIQSVFTLAFLSTLLIAYYRRRLWLAPFYLVIACLLAVAGNVLRVTTVAVVDHAMGWDWAEGWSHDLLGYATLAISALFLISFDRLITGILHPTGEAVTSSNSNPIMRLWNACVDDGSFESLADGYYRASVKAQDIYNSRPANRLANWITLPQTKPVMITLALVSVGLFSVTTVRAFSVERMPFEGGTGMFVDGLILDPSDEQIESIADQFTLTERSTSRGNENPILGRNADVWRYSTQTTDNGVLTGQFVMSQTYAKFHELCLCYENKKWELLNRSVRIPKIAERETPSVAYAVFRTPDNARGHLWYASITRSGESPTPPARPGRLGGRLAESFDATADVTEPIIMLQIWVTSSEPLEPSATEKVARDFALLREKIAEQIRKGDSKNSGDLGAIVPSHGQQSLFTPHVGKSLRDLHVLPAVMDVRLGETDLRGFDISRLPDREPQPIIATHSLSEVRS